jgi:DNA-binding MarR family transcriptional regulator
MSTSPSFQDTLLVRDACLCLHAQRAARALARHFDRLFRPLGLTNQQFSLLMSLNRPEPPILGDVAPVLGLDRTTLTAALKPLEVRGLVAVDADVGDRRKRRLALTPAGRALLAEALPLWRRAHGEIEAELGAGGGDALRGLLLRLEGLLPEIAWGVQGL